MPGYNKKNEDAVILITDFRDEQFGNLWDLTGVKEIWMFGDHFSSCGRSSPFVKQ